MTVPCPACGAPTSAGDHTCARCGQRLTTAAPLPEGIATGPGMLVSAGFGRRTLARLLDLVLTGFLGGALAAVMLLALGGDEALLDRNLPAAGFEMWLARTLMMLTYHGVAESLGGATLGKLIFSLDVVGEDGLPISLGRGLLRNLWVLVDSLAFGLVAYVAMRRSPRHQRLGDRHARTLVVHRRDLPAAARRRPATVAHGILIGLAFAAAICALAILLAGAAAPTEPTA
ncbi:RDD family protein [bacterium]|nr:RDD family protein [bacterium]